MGVKRKHVRILEQKFGMLINSLSAAEQIRDFELALYDTQASSLSNG